MAHQNLPLQNIFPCPARTRASGLWGSDRSRWGTSSGGCRNSGADRIRWCPWSRGPRKSGPCEENLDWLFLQKMNHEFLRHFVVTSHTDISGTIATKNDGEDVHVVKTICWTMVWKHWSVEATNIRTLQTSGAQPFYQSAKFWGQNILADKIFVVGKNVLCLNWFWAQLIPLLVNLVW